MHNKTVLDAIFTLHSKIVKALTFVFMLTLSPQIRLTLPLIISAQPADSYQLFGFSGEACHCC